MSYSLSLSPPGGGGGWGSGMFCLSHYAELLSTKLSFPSVILFVVSSLASSWFGSTSPVDVQLHWFVCRSECSVFSKAVFGRGGAPSCVGYSKWILRLEAYAWSVTHFPSSGRQITIWLSSFTSSFSRLHLPNSPTLSLRSTSIMACILVLIFVRDRGIIS